MIESEQLAIVLNCNSRALRSTLSRYKPALHREDFETICI